METEEARERRDEEVEEKRKKADRSGLSVETGASKLTSKAESNSYAGFNSYCTRGCDNFRNYWTTMSSL